MSELRSDASLKDSSPSAAASSTKPAVAPLAARPGWAKPWLIRLGAIVLALCWLALIATTWAEADANAAESGVSSDDDYSFKWLDPDKKIYVLQNRRYLKAGRPELSLLLGPALSNPYKTSFNIEPRFTYYFTEDLGLELFYIASSNSPNNTFNALAEAKPGVFPLVREIQSQYGAMLQWVPWYAKINVFNKILYFDWYLNAGTGSMSTQLDQFDATGNISSTTPQQLFAVYASTGHQYHLTDTIKIRFDISGAFYKTQIFSDKGDTSWFSNFNFGVGIGFRI